MKQLLCTLLIIFSGTLSAEALLPTQISAPDLFSFSFFSFPNPSSSVNAPFIMDSRFHALIPISHSEPDVWFGGITGANFHLGSPLSVSPSGGGVPQDLWTIVANVIYKRTIDSERSLRFNFGLGSDSDLPFHTINETAINFSGVYNFPASGKNQWLLGIGFSTNRAYLNYIPIPIVAYSFKSEDGTIEGSVGLPFAAIKWNFAGPWDLSAGALGPTNYTAEIGVRPDATLRISGGFYWNQQLWMLAGRADPATRLFYDSKKLLVGFQQQLFGSTSLDMSGGYVFNRSFFDGTSVFQQNNQTNINDGWCIGLTFKYLLASLMKPKT